MTKALPKATVQLPSYTTKRRYYKWVPWTRPNLTSNSSFGWLTGSGQHSADGNTRAYYKMFDGSLANGTMNHWGTPNVTTGWWMWTLPLKLKITKLILHSVDHYSTAADFNIQGKFFSDSTKTNQIGPNISITARYTVLEIDLGEGVETSVLYFQKTGGGAYSGFKEIEIEAQYLVEVTQDDDYDFYTEYPVYESYLQPKQQKLYYKKYTRKWSQPILTSNTGNAELQVAASSVEGDFPAWKSFKSNTADSFACLRSAAPSASNPWWYRIKTRNKIQLTSVLIKNRTGVDAGYAGSFKTFIVQGSNDGNTWTNITPTLTNTNNNNAGMWRIVVNSTTGYYYHRFYVTASNHSARTSMGYPVIEAVEEYIQLSTELDYDFYEVVTDREAITGYTKPEKLFFKYGNEPNITVKGTLTNNNGIVSGYSATSNARFAKTFTPSLFKQWKLQIKIIVSKYTDTRPYGTTADKTGSHLALQTAGTLVGYITTDGATWNIAQTAAVGTQPIPLNKWVYITLSHDGAYYEIAWKTADGTLSQSLKIASAAKMYPCIFSFGGLPYVETVGGLVGEIDFNECFIEADGKIWWKGTHPVECSEEEAEWSEWINIDKPIN